MVRVGGGAGNGEELHQALDAAEAGLAQRVLVDVEPALLRAVLGAGVRGCVRPVLAPWAPCEQPVEGCDEVVRSPERGEGFSDGVGGPHVPAASALPGAKIGQDATFDERRPVFICPGAGVRSAHRDGAVLFLRFDEMFTCLHTTSSLSCPK
jgi:hypothetical protein